MIFRTTAPVAPDVRTQARAKGTAGVEAVQKGNGTARRTTTPLNGPRRRSKDDGDARRATATLKGRRRRRPKDHDADRRAPVTPAGRQ
jgi:hypothetical protein